MIQIKQGTTILYTVNEFTFQEGEMSDSTVSLNLQLPASTAPNFAKDMYVEYLGEKFYLSDTKPQSTKSISSILYSYALVFDSQRSDLKKRMVRNLATLGEDTYISQGLVFSVDLNLFEFLSLIQINLNDCFGDKWVVDIHENVAAGENVKIDVNNIYIWDLLLKTFEYYGVRWNIKSESNTMRIYVGYPAIEIDHQFEYGSTTGLTKITREASTEKSVNRLRGVGGTRNVPINYFTHHGETVNNVKLNGHTGFPSDPNPIEGLFSFKNIMPTCFRDSVIDNTGFIDYVEDAALISQFGIIEDGLEPNEDIYPSIEGVTVSQIGRIDEIVSAEIIESDDQEATGVSFISSIAAVATIPYTIPSSGARGEQIFENSSTVDTDEFTTTEPCITAKLNLQYFDQLNNVHYPTGNYVFKTIDGKEVTIIGTPTVFSAELILIKVSDNSTIATTYIDSSTIGITKEISHTGIVAGTYKFRLVVTIAGMLSADSRTLTWSAKAVLYDIMNSAGIYKRTFDIWVKDIQFDLNETNEDGTLKYVGLDTGKIAFKSGDLAGYEFEIAKIGSRFAVEVDTTRTLNGVSSKYKITLIKSDAEYKSSGMMLPNTSVHAYPTSKNASPLYGDKFVLLDIQMPQSYIYEAEAKVQTYIQDQLNIIKVKEPTYTIELLDAFLALNPLITPSIRAGNIVTISDPILIDGSISLYINAVSINNKELLPKYTVTVTNKRTVNGSTVQRIQAQIDALYTGQYSNSQSTETSLLSLKNKFLQKNIKDTAFEEITFKKGAVSDKFKTGDFTQGQFNGTGGAMFKDPDGSSVIEIDRLRVRKEAIFNELVINQIKFQGGIVVYSAANMEVSRFEKIGDDYRLYFDTKGGTIHNQFEVNDIIRCQRFSYTDGESKYYSTIITDLGTDFIHISEFSKNPICTLNPEVGDQIVQFGNATNTNRQSIIEVDVLNGGKQTFYQHVNSYDLTNRNFIDIGMVQVGDTFVNMIRAYGNAYIGARNQSNYIKLDEATGTVELRGDVSFKSPIPNSDEFEYINIPIALENSVNNASISNRNYLRRSRTDNLTGWDGIDPYFGNYTVNVVNDAYYKNVVEITRLSGGGNYQKAFNIDKTELRNTNLVYYCICKDMHGTGGWCFGGWNNDEIEHTRLNNTCKYRDLGNGWRMYYKSFAAGNSIGSLGEFGLNSVGGIWRFHSFGVCKGKTPPTDWTPAIEDVQEDIEIAKQESIAQTQSYVNAINQSISGIQNQLDGTVDSWFFEYSPLTTNEPWATWLSITNEADRIAEQHNHEGDTFTNITEFINITQTPDSGKSWRFAFSDNQFKWVRIIDSESATALLLASQAKTSADGKCTVFLAKPTYERAYSAGDLWLNATEGSYVNDLLKCITPKDKNTNFNLDHWVLATKYTDNSVFNSWVTNAFTPTINTITSQIDKKAETFYQELMPIPEHTYNQYEDDSIENASNYEHLGDLWYQTTTKKTFTYKALNTGTLNPYTTGNGFDFKWVQMEIPIDVFDKFDGKASIFVSQPTSYNKNDMWILASDTTLNLVTYKAGTMLVATNKRTTFVSTDWVEKVKYTDDTAVNNLQIGGRNYCKKTDVLLNAPGVGSVSRVSDYEWYLIGAQNNSEVAFRMPNVINGNGYWTVSFDLAGDQDGAFRIFVDICDNLTPVVRTTSDNQFKRVSFTANITNYSLQTNNFIDINCPDWVHYRIKNIQIEKGNKATDFKLAPEDIQAQFDFIVSDAKVTPAEKLVLTKTWNDIVRERTLLYTMANTQQYDSADTKDYQTAYDALSTYLHDVLGITSSPNTTTAINVDTYKTKFDNYAIARNALSKMLSDNTYYKAESTENTVISWASDAVLSPIEKQVAKKEWDIIASEKSKLDAQADVYGVDKTTYTSKYTALYNMLWTATAPAIPLLSVLNESSAINSTNFIAAFKDYNDAKQNLVKSILDASKTYVGTTTNTAINNLEIGGGNQVVNGDFSSGMNGWNTNQQTVAPYTMQVQNGYEKAIGAIEHGAANLSNRNLSGLLTYVSIGLPSDFDFYYKGIKYSNIYVSSNSFISFGTGSVAYSQLGISQPAGIPAILVSTEYRWAQALYSGYYHGDINSNIYIIRYEGKGTNGTDTDYNLVWEAWLYKNSEIIDIHIITNGTTNKGIGGLWDGSTLYNNSSRLIATGGTSTKINSSLYPADINNALVVKTGEYESLSGLLKSIPYTVGAAHVLSFYIRSLSGNTTFMAGIKATGCYNDAIAIDGTWKRIVMKVTPATQNNTYFYALNAGTTFIISNIQLEKGTVATGWKPSTIELQAQIEAGKYLQQALATTTDTRGGLLTTALLRMKDTQGVISAGMSGLDDNIGFWAGGDYDKALADLANTILYKNGGARFAKGKLKWDEAGNLDVGNFRIVDGNIVGTVGGVEKVKIGTGVIPTLTSLTLPSYKRTTDEFSIYRSFEIDNSWNPSSYEVVDTFECYGALVLNASRNVKFNGATMNLTDLSGIFSAEITSAYFQLYVNGSWVSYNIGQIYSISAGTYSARMVVNVTVRVNKYKIGLGTVTTTQNGYIEVEQGVTKSEMGSDGIYSFFGETNFIYYKDGYGFEARFGTYGIRVTAAGVQKRITDGIGWVNL